MIYEITCSLKRHNPNIHEEHGHERVMLNLFRLCDDVFAPQHHFVGGCGGMNDDEIYLYFGEFY
jgi:hypothetical protein